MRSALLLLILILAGCGSIRPLPRDSIVVQLPVFVADTTAQAAYRAFIEEAEGHVNELAIDSFSTDREIRDAAVLELFWRKLFILDVLDYFRDRLEAIDGNSEDSS